MQLLDVNILIYAFRTDHAQHPLYKRWVDELVNAPRAFGISDLVASGFVRVVTNPRVFTCPDSTADALRFVDAMRRAPRAVVVAPGARHWDVFCDLCHRANVKGNLVADAYHAALAIEHNCEWITTDRDYARFPGLKWRSPF